MSERPSVIFVADQGIKGVPIWREAKVVGETSRSWLVEPDWKWGAPIKVPKKNAPAGDYQFTREGCDAENERWKQRMWAQEHSWRIGEKVRWVKDYDTLKAIAALVGYEVAK